MKLFEGLLRPVRRHAGRLLVLATVLAAAIGTAPAAHASGVTLSAAAAAQIDALITEKESRTPAQRKIDSQLLYASRMARGMAVADGVPTLDTGIEVDADGLAAIEIRAKPTTRLSLLIKALGGQVVRSFDFADAIEANFPIARIEELAADEDVRFVMPPAEGMTTRAGPTTSTTPGTLGLTPRMQRFKTTLEKALAEYSEKSAPYPFSGTANSEGDAAHGAATARNAYGLNGSGIRIGVLSDSVNYLGGQPADVASGNLPGVGNPAGFTTPVMLAGSGDGGTGSGDEGRAMLQIVHDLAPGAQLYFATAFNSATDFANNIRALRGIAASAPPNGNVTPGCDIIIDDVFYYTESGLHDGQPATSNQNIGLVSQAVNDVVADGALYFSSAGNSGSVTQGTGGAWEGDFVPGTLPSVAALGSGDALIWSGSDVGNSITSNGNTITMHWSDPVGASSNDYDLFRLNAAMTSVAASSTNVQTGTQDPYERVTSATNGKLVVVRRNGAALRFISLSSNRGKLQYATPGQTRGHSSVPAAFGVAATPAAATAGAPTPNGPYPGVFVATNQVEYFSSDGPRRSFFNADGSAITPGNFLAGSNGGTVRQKPDFTAADGVVTTLPSSSGLNPFYGTSAAAPHAGAIAALLKQAAPTATPAQIRNYLTSTALDIMAPGTDRDSGAGILQAMQALQAAGATPQAYLSLGSSLVATGNGRIDPNECNTLTITLRNDGAAAATGLNLTLATSTPNVSVTQSSATIGSIAPGASDSASFQVSTAPEAVDGSTIAFTLTISYTGGASPRVVTFTLPLGADVNNYVFSATPTGAAIPAGGVLVPGSADDDKVVTTTTPFAFSVYGTAIAAGQTISLSTNGNIQFVSSGGSTAYDNTALPGTVLPNAPAVFPYWDDLVLTNTGGGIYVNTVGTAPNRQFIVEWRGHRYQDGATTNVNNFAVIFNEGSNQFRFVYVASGTGANANGASATVGVQAGNTTSSRRTQYSFNGTGITSGLQLDAGFPTPTPGSGACVVSDVIFQDGFDLVIP